jgi:predicted secreted protein
MGIAGSLVAIIVIWWLAFFILLPIGIRSQLEEGVVEPGTVESAPAIHNLKFKALIALAVALVLWAAIFSIINLELITLEDLLGAK